MRKSELIEKLNEIEGDPVVMTARDAEGNGFAIGCTVELSCTRDGEPCHPDDTDDGEKVLVIWPI